MEKPTSAERQPRNGNSWVADYLPRSMEPATWQLVRPIVVRCCGRLELCEGPSARRVVRALARLVAWAAVEGLPLDVELVLDPDTVERFVTVGLANDRSRATYRAVLRRVAPLLTSKAPWAPRPPAVARRQVALPYNFEDVDGLRRDALAQPTASRVRAGRALLALGAGAGLDGRWVARVAADDVAVAGRVVLVRVAKPSARVVPVLGEWEDEVLELAASAGSEFLVGGRSTAKNRAGALAASLVVANGRPRFSLSRLRSTWLVTHMASGTRLPELARAAGLQGVTVLSDLLPFVPALEDDEANAMLRGVR